MTSRKHAGDSEESPLTESMHLCTGSMDNPSLIKRTVTSSGEHYGSTHSVQSSMALHNMKESGKKYKRRKVCDKSRGQVLRSLLWKGPTLVKKGHFCPFARPP